MCVIAIKPRKVSIDWMTVRDMFDTNPDGAGFAVVCKEKTIISKGYMSLPSLWQDIQEIQNELVVLHFRLATHGQTNQEMTHPFIVTNDLNIATQIYTETDEPVLIHNGILTGYGNDEISDTCDFCVNTLYPLVHDERMKLLKFTKSKFTLIDAGTIHVVGDFQKFKGLKVSNTNFNFTTYKGNRGTTKPKYASAYGTQDCDTDYGNFGYRGHSSFDRDYDYEIEQEAKAIEREAIAKGVVLLGDFNKEGNKDETDVSTGEISNSNNESKDSDTIFPESTDSN